MSQCSPIYANTTDDVPLHHNHNHLWRNYIWKKIMEKTSKFSEAF